MIAGYIAVRTGATTADRHKFVNKFVAVSQRVWDSSSASTPTYGWYSDEIGGWVTGSPTALGQTRDVNAGESYYSDSDLETKVGTISAANFVSVSIRTVGSGTCVATAGTYGNFAIQNRTVSFSTSPGTGMEEASFKVNGVTSEKTFTATTDMDVVTTFVRASFTVRNRGTSGGGSHVVKVNGVTVASSSSVSATRGQVISVTATAPSGKRFVKTVIGTYESASASTSYAITGEEDATISVVSYFESIPQLRDTIQVGAHGSVTVYHGQTVVTLAQDGSFAPTVGETYRIVATPDSGYRVDGFFEGDTRVSSTSEYSFVQGSLSRTIRVSFAAISTITVSLYSGNDASSSSQTWEGCTCTKEMTGGSEATNIGTYLFTPSASTGHTFVRLYIEDEDGTGKGRVIPAGQSLSVYIDFNARVVAIFKRSDEPVDPTDQDQGDATMTTASIKVWEGSSECMVARWRSRRNVFVKPIALSSARVYANGYNSNGPILTIGQYQSPYTADGRETVRPVSSQDAFRLPSVRAEKYVEIEVAADSRVLEMAVSTSMEGLWRTNS